MARAKRLKYGTFVRSHYRSPWYGVIVEQVLGYHDQILRILVTHDAKGLPQRKPFVKILHHSYLEVVPKLPSEVNPHLWTARFPDFEQIERLKKKK